MFMCSVLSLMSIVLKKIDRVLSAECRCVYDLERSQPSKEFDLYTDTRARQLAQARELTNRCTCSRSFATQQCTCHTLWYWHPMRSAVTAQQVTSNRTDLECTEGSNLEVSYMHSNALSSGCLDPRSCGVSVVCRMCTYVRYSQCG